MRALERHAISLGSELSIFHKRGAFFPEEIEQLSRIGEWKALWEKRLDQLEKFWQSQVMNHPTDVFDQLFIESFPYYLGVAENAIQYVVDTEMDDTPQLTDAKNNLPRTIHTFIMASNEASQTPFDWVYDHPTRDIAELIRYMMIEKERLGANNRSICYRL